MREQKGIPRRQLTLLIPGLWGAGSFATRPDAVTGLRAPALATLLARADRMPRADEDLERALCGLFGIKAEAGHDLPIAPLTLLADGGAPDQHWWLRADPVHLRADRDTVVMLGQRGLDITQDDAAQLAAELNAVWRAEGWHLEARTPHHWYLSVPTDPEVRTEPLMRVLLQPIFPHLPQGTRAREWRRVLNEVQMVLHASPINAAREARGAPIVNSVWFWGGGVLPAHKAQPWSQIWSNEPVGTGLARWAGVPHTTAPGTVAEWLGTAGPGAHLVVLHGAQEALQSHDAGRWREFVQGVDEEWLAPLLAAIKAGSLERADLYAASDLVLRLTRGGLRRWWRRGSTLQAWPE